MPVFRIDNFVDAYRLRAQSADIHELAARPNKTALTVFVSRQILEAIQPRPDDTLVDIGCGDATLLRMASGCTGKCIGIVGTVEEKIRLEGATPNVSFIASNAQNLLLESAIASKIVCNAALFYLSTAKAVQASLREIARVARPGATIWVGEMPVAEEGEYYRRYRGNSMPAYLWFLLRHNGLRSFLGMIRRWSKAVFGSERIILNSAEIFYTEPEAFIPLAESCGLQLKSHFRHKDLDDGGKVIESKFRYDYVFTV
jgi:ubiquinone/menaquinone biosynthesis C-methylase UbiE